MPSENKMAPSYQSRVWLLPFSPSPLSRLTALLLCLAAACSGSGDVPCPCTDSHLCQPVNITREKEIVVFSVEGIQTEADWHYYDWDHITTVVYFHKPVDEELMCYAHSRGVRVLEAGEFSLATLRNETARKLWTANAVNRALENHLDGINLDIELTMNGTEAALLTSMVEMVTGAFHRAIPGSRVSFDGPFTPDSRSRPYEYDRLAEILDYIIIMAYDEPTVVGGEASSHDPYSETTEGIQTFFAHGLPPSKLVLAVPWYGYDFNCTRFSVIDNSCYLGRAACFRCAESGVARHAVYRDIMTLLRYNATSAPIWNNTCQSVYFSYKDSSTGQMHQVWYDNPTSLTLRYYYARATGLLGVGMWTADSLDYSDDPIARQQTKAMWDAVARFLETNKFLDRMAKIGL